MRSNRRKIIESLESRQHLHGDVDVTFNFQPQGTPLVAGTLADFGHAYANRGNGYTYGWNVDNRGNMRDRNKISDQARDTLAQMQSKGNFTWEVEIPNGQYAVTINSGDARYLDGQHHITAEGTMVMYGVQTPKKQFLKITKTITVNDGKLTLAPGPNGVNTKINWVKIQSVHTDDEKPVVSVTAVDDSAKEFSSDTGVIRVSRAGGESSAALAVSLAWSGSVRRGDVSSPLSSTVTIPANATSVDIPVVAGEDDLQESLERLQVDVVSGSAYTLSNARRAFVYITNAARPVQPGNPTVSIAATDASATEAADSGTLTLTRSGGDLTQSLTVNLNWSGSAGSGDVNTRPGSFTFAANVSSGTITVTATDDALDEADETATATLASSTSYAIASGGASASVIIKDNDETPNQSFTNITWTGTTAPPISFSESTSAVVNGKLYLFGGFNGLFVPQKNVYRFDGTSWQTMNDAPSAFTHVGHAEVDGSVWFVGGYLGNSGGGQTFGTTQVLIYNTANDTWGTGPALPTARASGNLVKVGRKLYFFGGETLNRTADATEMWMLDLDNQGAGWTARAAMPLSRNHASALEVNGKIVVLGGQTGYDSGLVAHDDIQTYDPSTNTWSVASQKLPAVRSHTSQSAHYHRGRIILVTGESAHNVPVNTVWSIDPSTLVTTALGNFPDARFSTATGILNDKLYAFGGYAGFIPNTSYVGTFV